MGLLSDLREASAALDPQFQPSSNEIGPLLGALIAYQEHGKKFLKAAEDGTDAVTELVAGAPDDDDDSDDDDDGGKGGKGKSQTGRATSQKTQVEHHPGG